MLVIRSLFQMEAPSPVMDAADLDFVILPRSLSRSGASLLISDTSGIGSPLLLRGLAHPGMLILPAGTLRSGSLPPACDLVFPGLGLPLRSFSCLGFPVSVVSAHVPGSFPPLQAFFCAGSFVPPAGVARLGLLPPVSAGAAPEALLPSRSFAQPGAQTLRALSPPPPSRRTPWWKLRKSALPATRPGLASPVLALADLESPPLPQARPGEQPLQERFFMSRLHSGPTWVWCHRLADLHGPSPRFWLWISCSLGLSFCKKPAASRARSTCQDWALHCPREVLHAQMSLLRRCSFSTQADSNKKGGCAVHKPL